MKMTLRVVNIALMALMAFTAIGILKDGLAEAIGASLWLVPPLLALRAVQNPTAGRVRATLISNGLAIILVIGLIVGLGITRNDGATVSVGLLILGVPFALNIWGIRRLAQAARADEAKTAAADDEIPLLPESEAMGASAWPTGRAPALAVDEASSSVEHATPTTAPAVTAAKSSALPNYFIRHWRGDLSLPVSYWINGSLISAVVAVLILLTSELIGKEVSVRTSAWFGLAVIALLLTVMVWSPVGIWRSAERHASRGGSPGWAKIAQVVVVLGLLSSFGTLNKTILPMLTEYSKLAVGYDKFGRISATVTSNGAAIVLKGGLGLGSAEDVSRLLDQAPGVRTLVLDSAGGRLREAELIARLTRKRELNTYVETHCESACTYIFMAGRDRAATPNARLGFHRPSFPGFDDAEMADATREMLEVYRTAGVAEAFLARVERTESSDMWYPSRDELIDAHVINRVSLGGEQAREMSTYRSKSELALAFHSVELMRALDARFPGLVDSAIDAAWKAHEQGGQDGEIYSASRQLIAANYPKLLALVDDEMLGAFLNLTFDQLTAAQAVSDEACERLINGQLDIRQVLPKDLFEREQSWLLKALKTPPVQAAKSVSKAEMERVIMPFLSKLKQPSLEVLAEPEKYRGQAAIVCDANLDLIGNLHALPATSRAHIFRTLQLYGEE